MMLKSLGYLGVNTTDVEGWRKYGTTFLGMQAAKSDGQALSFRMDAAQQRLTVAEATENGLSHMGWEVDGPETLDALAVRLERAGVTVRHGTRDLCEQRRVTDLIVFSDPVENRLEAFYGLGAASEPFTPGRTMSGFRTGEMGIGHAVLMVPDATAVLRFYREILGFRLSDYFERPFKAFFLHLNQRHHSLAILQMGSTGIHHLMFETLSLDDVGQAYDLALVDEGRIATTIGRHTNDQVVSFYAKSPSGFLVECGWGGLSVDVETWKPYEVVHGPSLWGHDRNWLPPEKQEEARQIRFAAARNGARAPVHVINGLYDASPT
ncbi:VOC family protein [Paraburkholderia sediminicola]|nr:VOC family protein [Paraburkholderia sediminicola]